MKARVIKEKKENLINDLRNGGKTTYCEPKIIKDFDKSDMSQYYFCLIPKENGQEDSSYPTIPR